MKLIYTIYLLVTGRRCTKISLYIAISRLRTSWLHAKGYNTVGLACKLECRNNNTSELITVSNNMIGRRNDNIGIGVLLLDSPTDVGNTWSRVAATWFLHDVTRRNLGQLLLYKGCILLVCNHPHILWVANTFESVECQLYQSTTCTKYINKLLGFLLGAHRPESTAYSTCHDYQMIIFVSHNPYI